jgi:paraquat-inducible protein B
MVIGWFLSHRNINIQGRYTFWRPRNTRYSRLVGCGIDTRRMPVRNSASLFQKVDSELVPRNSATLEAAQRSFDAANATLAKDSPLQADVHQALDEFRRTLVRPGSLPEYLQRHSESLLWGKPDRN